MGVSQTMDTNSHLTELTEGQTQEQPIIIGHSASQRAQELRASEVTGFKRAVMEI
jgi:hypothetical protein